MRHIDKTGDKRYSLLCNVIKNLNDGLVKQRKDDKTMLINEKREFDAGILLTNKLQELIQTLNSNAY